MKSALECNPHSNVIRNFWEKKKRNPRIVFEGIRYIFCSKISYKISKSLKNEDASEASIRVPQNSPKFRKIPQNSTKFHKIPQNSAKYRKILKNSEKFCKNSAKISKIPQNTAKFQKIPQNKKMRHFW